MMIPECFLVGAAKCGTTSVANFLSQHPNVFIPEHKEPHFFSTRDLDLSDYNLDVDFLSDLILEADAYTDLYRRKTSNHHISVDASTSYFYRHEKFAEALKRYGGHPSSAKVIIMLRDPIDRAVSHYNYMLRRGYNHRSSAGILEEITRVPSKKDWAARLWDYDYLGHSNYEERIKFFEKSFSNLLVIESNELKSPVKLMKKLEAFLNLPEYYGYDFSHKANPSGELATGDIFGRVMANRSLGKVLRLLTTSHTRRFLRKVRDSYLHSSLEKKALSEQERRLVSLSFDRRYK